MSSRRTFLSTAALASATPVITTFGFSPAAIAADSTSPDADLTRQMVARLSTQLNDATTASTEASYLKDLFFDWDLTTVAIAQVTSIIAYSFGSRPGAAGALPVAGPVNEQIADTVYKLHLQKAAPIFAQAEVASILASKYSLTGATLRSFSPPTISGGTIVYPTLDSVAAAIVTSAGGAASLGKVAVVTHRDQATRAIQTSISHGINAFAAEGLTLPTAYDEMASQPANRRRDLYLLNDMTARFASLRLALIAQEYPNG